MFNTNKLDLFLIFAVCLIPLLILTGPFLPDLFLSLVALTFIYIIFSKKKFEYINNTFGYIFIIFFIILVLSSLLSEFIIFSLETSIVYFRFYFFSLCVWYLIDTNKNFIKYFSIILFFSILFAIVDGYVQYFNGLGIFGFGDAKYVRLSLPLNDKTILGGYISRMLPLLIALMILQVRSKKLLLLILFFFLILSDILIYISGERTALGLLFLFTFFLILFLSNYKLFRVFTVIFSIIIILLINSLDSEIKDRNIDKTIQQLGFSEASERINIFSPIHEQHIITAYKIFVSKPLLGSGPNTFRKLCHRLEFNSGPMSCSTHPHSTYIQLLSEIGLVGFFIFTIFILFLCKIMSQHIFYGIIKKDKKYKLSDYQICIIGCLVLSLWPLLPSLNFFNNWINIIYYLPMGFFLQFVYSKSDTVK